MTPPQDDLLPIDNEHARVYRCPGESAPVSHTIHLARMASGWHGCRDCIWNADPAEPGAFSRSVSVYGQSEQRSAEQRSAEQRVAEQRSTEQRVAEQRRTGIQRTASGVRGSYLNAIDRFRAAQLAAIFSTHLARVSQVQQSVKTDESRLTSTAKVTVAMGYDQRNGSQDLYAGVVSAVLQNGCDVYDLGECTCCTLLSFVRDFRQTAGCLMVTGAGGRAGEVGLDAFDRDGRGLSVPWNDFGVGLRVPQTAATTFESAPTGLAERLLGNADRQMLPVPQVPDSDEEFPSFLQLPDLGDSTSLFRNGRSSGQLHSLSHESAYLGWLKRWWPKNQSIRTGFQLCAPRVQERIVQLLPTDADAQFVAAGEQVTKPGRVLMRLEEDDRFVTVVTPQGRSMTTAELADWINRASRTTNSHVTAHPSRDGRHVLLVDVARPESGRSHEIIVDGLAVAGLVLTLLQNQKNSLPR